MGGGHRRGTAERVGRDRVELARGVLVRAGARGCPVEGAPRPLARVAVERRGERGVRIAARGRRRAVVGRGPQERVPEVEPAAARS